MGKMKRILEIKMLEKHCRNNPNDLDAQAKNKRQKVVRTRYSQEKPSDWRSLTKKERKLRTSFYYSY